MFNLIVKWRRGKEGPRSSKNEVPIGSHIYTTFKSMEDLVKLRIFFTIFCIQSWRSVERYSYK